MQSGDSINTILINTSRNYLHLFSMKFVLKYVIQTSENTSYSKLPNSIYKFLGHS